MRGCCLWRKRSSCESHLERASKISLNSKLANSSLCRRQKCLHSQKAIQAKVPVSSSDKITNLIAQAGRVIDKVRVTHNKSDWRVIDKVRVTHNVCVSPPPCPGPPHHQPPHPTRLASPKSFVRFTEIVTQTSPGRFSESQH